jgi:hypothetical protein
MRCLSLRPWPGLAACLLLSAALPTAAEAQDGAGHLVIISALSGEPRFAAAFTEWGATLATAATQRHGVPEANVVWLAESEDADPRIRGRSTREVVERELRALAGRAGPRDRITIVMFGHGSFADGESSINLPGPDINGTALAALLDLFGERRVTVVNTTSASGGFVAKLAAANRIVMTATRSGMERNETVFGRHFVAAFAGDEADTDRDGRVSMLEAFEYARREVEREYERDGKLRTEHAVLDAVGDGRGVPSAEATSAHGRMAHTFYMGVRAVSAAAATATPELRAAYEEKARLETALDALRARRDSMTAADYEARLESLLVEISLNAQRIRRLEAGGR